MKAEVLTIGNELLRGETIDSNKSLLSQRLLSLDVETRWQVTCANDRDDLAEAFRRAASRSDVVLVSGGVGPAPDDLTMEVLAATFGRRLVVHQPSLDAIHAFLARQGRAAEAGHDKPAWVPEGSDILPNPMGSAPGAMLEVPLVGAGAGALEERNALGAHRAFFFCMPSGPHELARMMDEQVLHRIAAQLGVTTRSRSRLLRTFGIDESDLGERLQVIELPAGVELGLHTHFPDVHVRPVATAATDAEAREMLERSCTLIRDCLGALVYAEGEETLASATGRILIEHGATLAVAESCTGGMIGQQLTAVPGSSAYFKGDVVAYWNEAKTALLDVPEWILAEHSAVSEPTARAMAEGARTRFASTIAVATTGIAGPSGGTPEKPVGLVFVALATTMGSQVHELQLGSDRARNRRLTSQIAIDWVRRHLLGEPLDLPMVVRADKQ